MIPRGFRTPAAAATSHGSTKHGSGGQTVECLSASQRRTLTALVDTFMPGLSEAEAAAATASAPPPPRTTFEKSKLPQYLAATGAEEYVVAGIETAIATRLNAAEKAG